jgi:hypothetical protein
MSRRPDFSFLQLLTLALLDRSKDDDFTAGASTERRGILSGESG